MRTFPEEAGKFGNKGWIWRLSISKLVGEAMGKKEQSRKTYKVRRGKMRGPGGKFPSLSVGQFKE